jgi:hypothetical protein
MSSRLSGSPRCLHLQAGAAVHWLLVACLLGAPNLAWAGSIFLTGHDPDFHAVRGPNSVGAKNINAIAIGFVRDPAFNPFVTDISRFLFVESNIPAPRGHVIGKDGIVASGFVECSPSTESECDFEHHDATTLDLQLDRLGTKYDAIVVASDFGGLLTQAELDVLNDRSSDIIEFLETGGGLYAMAESNSGAKLTPDGGHFGFLPFGVGSTPVRGGFDARVIVWIIGESLGLETDDVNGNYSHNVFDDTFGLEIVDLDYRGILGLAGREAANQTPQERGSD